MHRGKGEEEREKAEDEEEGKEEEKGSIQQPMRSREETKLRKVSYKVAKSPSIQNRIFIWYDLNLAL